MMWVIFLGHVNFFDVNTGQELHAFKEHKAPATDLAFSPVNDVLVLSSGLDKRCVCYDTMTKKPVSTIWTDWPLTAVDFALDGTNLVLGTTKVWNSTTCFRLNYLLLGL